MEKIEGNYLTQTNKDFPLDCETLEYIAQNCAMSEMLGNIGGDKLILYGCDLKSGTTNQYNAGYVFLKTNSHPTGEVLHFAGGTITSFVSVEAEAVTVTTASTTYQNAYTKRSLVAGSGDENYLWSAFKYASDINCAQLKALYDALKATVDDMVGEPYGIVKMWAGSADVPDGYHLCDGSSLTTTTYPNLFAALGYTFGGSGTTFRLPDLRGRFIVGQQGSDNDYASKGNTGGEKAHKLTESELPSHTHQFTDDSNAKSVVSAAGTTWLKDMGKISGSDNGAGCLFKTSATGGGQAHENRPPYFVLAYIMKLG